MSNCFLLNRLFPLALVSLVAARSANSADPSFTLETNSPKPYTSAYLGNGAFSLSTTVLATDPAHSFLAGVYDHSPGDVPRIASAPAWNEVDVSNGIHWLNAAAESDIQQYRQQLDMYNGVLHTSYRWNDSGKSMQIRVDQFVSRDNPHLAAVSVTVTPEFSGKLSVRLPLSSWPAPHRYDLALIRNLDPAAQKDPWIVWYPGQFVVNQLQVIPDGRGSILSLTATAPGTDVKLGEAVAIQSSPQLPSASGTGNNSEVESTFDAQAGHSYTFTKFAAIVVAPGQQDVGKLAIQQAQAARQLGWNRLLLTSTDAWHTLWQTDIVVVGNPALQRIIHSMLFYLLASTRENLDCGLGPMGLSSAGYYGHIFWDADTFMFPPLLLLHPELAKPIVAFRSRTRPTADENARQNGFRGAMYPWEADAQGHESTPRFAFQNASSENHVNGDVALAAWQYWLATGDRDWLQNDCWPILRDTADFWTSRVSFDKAHGQYIIGHVVAVNESQVGVSNDPYTNAIAQKNLQIARAAAGLLHREANPMWKEVAEKMYIPEATSPLLWFPLDRSYSREQTRQAIQNMLSRIDNHHSGGMMQSEFYPILAAQLSDRAAIGKLFEPLCLPYLRPPFQVIAETPTNQNINFITGAGAFLQQFVFGYTGLRMTENGLERRFPPTLPPGITQITLKNITIRGQRQSLSFPAQ